MITPGQYDIDNLISGADWRLRVTLQDSQGQPLNLTGYAFAASIWSDFRAQKYCDMEVSVLDVSAGVIELFISDQISSALPVTSGNIGFWDLLVTAPGGDSYYWLRGDVYLTTGGSRKA